MTDCPETAPETQQPAGTHGNLCAELYADMHIFVDGALTEARRIHLQAHVIECPPCAKAVEFHVQLKMVVRRRCQTELPAGMRDRIFSQLAE